MLACQRWRDRRDSYRPAGEPINTRAYEVAEIADDATPKAFVQTHHYSGSYPAARFRFGLYRGGQLVGVSIGSVPCRPSVITNVFPIAALEGVDLGRFVLLDDVPANGESWFQARCFELLHRAGITGVISSSDPVARTTAEGRVIFAGHVGVIYQALNAVYLGRGTARTLRLLPDGTVFSARAAQKIRARDRGWRYAVEQLVRAGAVRPGVEDDLRSWLRTWLPVVTRPLKHSGNHRYAWALDRRLRRHLGAAGPYPKTVDAGR